MFTTQDVIHDLSDITLISQNPSNEDLSISDSWSQDETAKLLSQSSKKEFKQKNNFDANKKLQDILDRKHYPLSPEDIMQLIRLGANPNLRGGPDNSSLLHELTRTNCKHHFISELLNKHHANIDIIDDCGKTAFQRLVKGMDSFIITDNQRQILKIAIDFYNKRGWNELKTKDYEKALQTFNKILELDNDNKNAYAGLVRSLLAKGKDKKALFGINQAIKISKIKKSATLASYYALRAEILLKQNNYALAIASCEKAHKLKGETVTTWDIVGKAHFELKDMSSALNAYNKAIALSPNSATCITKRGYIYAQQGNLRAAVTDFIRALTLNPQSKIAINNLTSILKNLETNDDLTAIGKEMLFEAITKLPLKEQIPLLQMCIRKGNVLGDYMYMPRNCLTGMLRFFNYNPEDYESIRCDINKGILKTISDYIKTMNIQIGLDKSDDTLGQEMVNLIGLRL